MEANFYSIKCITNMHMGNGDINFNIIDNEVQKDPVTGLPIMFSSGIKGALREHFGMSEDVVKIFGSDIMTSNEQQKGKSVPGKLKFLSGYLLFLPVRASKGDQAYYMVTSKELLAQFDDLCEAIKGKKIFGDLLNEIKSNITYGPKGAEVDGIKSDNNNIPENLEKSLCGMCNCDKEKIMIMSAEELRKISLPVIARNQLDNGESKNLWYEEIVPHDAIFYSAVLSDGTVSGNEALESFDNYIEKNLLVQFGGNASVGYGLTKVTKMEV